MNTCMTEIYYGEPPHFFFSQDNFMLSTSYNMSQVEKIIFSFLVHFWAGEIKACF